IRYDAVVLKGEQATGAPESGLYLIQDQQCTRFITALSQCLQVSSVRNTYACFALHGFKDDRSSMLRNNRQVCRTVEADKPDIRQEGGVGMLVFRIPEQAQCALRAAMVCFSGRNQLLPAGIAFGDFHSTFRGFGT